jgi:hypothetical protein
MESEKGPRQCPKCGSRRWNDGEVAQADLLLRAFTFRHLNPIEGLLAFDSEPRSLRRNGKNHPFETVIY